MAPLPTISIAPLDEASRPAITRAVLLKYLEEQPAISAGSHRITYRYVDEIRFGPQLYEASVEGPRGRQVTDALRGRKLLHARGRFSPYNPARDWYVFPELDVPAERTVFHIFDLGSGRPLGAFAAGAGAQFVGWRGDVPEFVIGAFESFRVYSWHAITVPGARSRPMGRGGFEPYLTADGRLLLALETRAILIALFDVEAGVELARRTKADLLHLSRRVETLEVVEFDAVRGELTAMLNWRRTDMQTREVDYDCAISIGIVVAAGEGE